MALVDFVDAMQVAFTERLCPVPIYLGEQFLHDHAGDNRIVIIPGADSYGPSSPSVTVQEMVVGGKSVNPRSLMTRMVGGVAHFWAMCPLDETAAADILAEDHRYLNALINCFCASMNGVAGGVASIEGGTYVNDNAVHDRRGLAYQLTFSVGIPVIDVAWPGGETTYTEESDIDADVTIVGENPVEETEETILNFSTADA